MATLIKIGGSLTPTCASRIYRALKKSHLREKIFFFPGGGLFADLIRKYRKDIHLKDITTHRMALASLEQNAFLLSDMCRCSFVTTLSETRKIRNTPVVIAPYRLLTDPWPFKKYNLNIDVFSSDASALYCAHLLKAKFIIATDVDGVYDKDPRHHKGFLRLFDEMKAADLKKIKRGGPLDGTVADMMVRYKMNTWVINGWHPERIIEIIRHGSVSRGTLIRYQ